MTRVLSIFLCAALALTSLPANAQIYRDPRNQTGDDPLAEGIVSLLLLGTLLANARDDDDDDDDDDRRPRGRYADPYAGDRHYTYRPRPGRNYHLRPGRVLPSECLRVFDNRNYRYVYMAGCLRRNGYDLDRFPRRCRVDVRTHRGERRAYRGRCLREAGYRGAFR
ncbi:hypothetical protein AADZ90_003590 [Aestuariibius sp. 2305UL40-4]|uniref:hypothetical protein n=1 Tax=Aestuariibius violaceus TaxID=3234132 RepID=UPI00345E69A3